jgi:hypothetical protein
MGNRRGDFRAWVEVLEKPSRASGNPTAAMSAGNVRPVASGSSIAAARGGIAQMNAGIGLRARSMKIDAELSKDDICSALGITVKSPSPALSLCRKLIALGHDPSTPLDARRGDVLCLRIRSIGEAAGLEVSPIVSALYGDRERRRRPLMRSLLEAAE